jgi:Leucine-rich repeat (LRR) protein
VGQSKTFCRCSVIGALVALAMLWCGPMPLVAQEGRVASGTASATKLQILEQQIDALNAAQLSAAAQLNQAEVQRIYEQRMKLREQVKALRPWPAPFQATDMRRWTAELDDPKYKTRTAAQLHLVRCGEPVIAHLDQSSKTLPLEAQYRIRLIVQEIRLKRARELFADLGIKPNINRSGQLRILRLRCTGLQDDHLRCLEAFPRLVELDVRFTNITDKGLKHIRTLTGLEILNVQKTLVTNQGLKLLKPLKKLKSLSIEKTMIDDAGLEMVGSFPELETLYLGGSSVKGPGLGHLAKLTKLRYLSFQFSSHFNDASARHLGTLPELETLGLDDTGITNEALKTLPPVQTLWLSNQPVNDAGLRLLEGRRELKRLYLKGTEVTPAGIKAFKAKAPYCRVIR